MRAKSGGVAQHAEPEPPKATDQRDEIVAEIRNEYPDADEQEIKLGVAIRESFGATHEEENSAYERISKALAPNMRSDKA